jgi:hypothetical protein
MIVRNLLVVAPFVAIAAARGAASVGAWLGPRDAAPIRRLRDARTAQRVWVALLAVALGINVAWLITCARSIVDRSTDRFAREAAAFVREHRETTFLLSPRVKRDLAFVGLVSPNFTASPAEADAFVFYAREGMRRWHDWPANRRDLTRTWFGPREVNFNIYPNWWGDDRILVIDRAQAAEIGLLVAGVTEDVSPPTERAPELGSSLQPTKHEAASVDALPSSWVPSSIDPRLLVTIPEAQSIIGALARGPVLGSWELDGHGCTFVAEDGTVVSLVIISTGAFRLERFNRGSAAISGVGAHAYTTGVRPFGDVRLFARTAANAVVVLVADRSGSHETSLARAKRFAEIALARLDALQSVQNQQSP